ncbi:tetratricopeptide repeat protein [Nocardiopsis sp. HUAS JQ3]|uniref:tetratricopeptide repeat protein n=1 Tax=Nocardiopsis sp. HUAS JQ3 TaxID=3061629 RepID=UPI0023A98255|nr:tetratricopeptide repeat protein [Nocardiopsis sp. HUAS JQ3]WDZ92858.1 tetratricopeptide repeat protein [Nocardiopsis sp. HUAS JQ3]
MVVAAGMGGVGKTQLALTAAHQARREKAFSRALFLDLRGYTTPVNAHRALQSLLVSLGVAEERIPEEEGARAGLYRATLHAQANEHGGPVLVVADNASHPDQVQPLAPGPGGHRLLVTSRERLGSLPARQVKVGTLTDEEAFQVVVADLRLADPDDERVHDLQGLTALAKACAGLPLALRIAAGQLKNAPDLQAGELARTLAHGADRIVHFTDHRELVAVFASSTARLPIEQAELFTLLGMAPGPDISTAAAAVLAGTDEPGVLVQLRGLAASHLLTASQGRWSMHDLVAAYAATRDGPHLPSRFPRARRRLLDHYTNRAVDAVRHLRALSGQEVPGTFAGPEQAWAWLDTERAVLINTAHTAHRTGHARATTSLPLNLGHYLSRRRLFSDLITLTRLALDTAQRQGNRTNQAVAWNNLGGALHEVRRFEEALEAHTCARDLFQQTSDVHGEAVAWNNLGNALREVRRFAEALEAHTRARDLHRQLGDVHGEAEAWNNLGNALQEVRRFTEALEAYTRARGLYRQLGDVHGEAGAWNNLGNALQEVRRFTEALEAHTRARGLYRQLGDVHGEAGAWNNLGNALREVRRFEEALEAHTRARDLFQQTSDAHGAENAGAGVGIALGGLERWQEAVQALEGAVAFFRQIGDQHFQGRAGYELGLVYHRSGSLGRAVPVLEEAVELLDSTNDPYHHNQAREALDKARADSDGGQEPNDDQN